ncbi:MAG TPA: T9SS type A sorting domain-containing protein [Bacteroidia bacterium]|jgi:hypothetical protein|nr:T9SS type A sorting domain-containing protein [Bacteroidia bacterium]
MNFCNKIFLVVYFWLFVFSCVYAQNLVPNPSFETYTACPTASSQIYYAPPWTGPTANSTDYFNVCSSIMGVPVAGVGYQYPRTGNAYAGFWGYDAIGSNYREYLQVQLNNVLLTGKCYYLKFYTNLLNGNSSTYIGAINNIAAHISNISYTTSSSNGNVLSLIPHALKFGNPILRDTLNWMEISGIYIATGGEDHIIIGNFYNDTQTDTSANFYSSFSGFAYYYIDDVSVIPTDSISMPPHTGNDTTIVLGDSVFIGQQLYGLHCNWYGNSVLLDTNISGIWVKPTVTTTYVVEQNLCGNMGYDTVVVNVSPLGINKFKNEGLKIYPNPAKEILIIEWENKNGGIKIIDVFGSIIKQQNIVSDKTTINVSDLKEGVYFMQVQTKQNSYTQKIIVQH